MSVAWPRSVVDTQILVQRKSFANEMLSGKDSDKNVQATGIAVPVQNKAFAKMLSRSWNLCL